MEKFKLGCGMKYKNLIVFVSLTCSPSAYSMTIRDLNIGNFMITSSQQLLKLAKFHSRSGEIGIFEKYLLSPQLVRYQHKILGMPYSKLLDQRRRILNEIYLDRLSNTNYITEIKLKLAIVVARLGMRRPLNFSIAVNKVRVIEIFLDRSHRILLALERPGNQEKIQQRTIKNLQRKIKTVQNEISKWHSATALEEGKIKLPSLLFINENLIMSDYDDYEDEMATTSSSLGYLPPSPIPSLPSEPLNILNDYDYRNPMSAEPNDHLQGWALPSPVSNFEYE